MTVQVPSSLKLQNSGRYKGVTQTPKTPADGADTQPDSTIAADGTDTLLKLKTTSRLDKPARAQ